MDYKKNMGEMYKKRMAEMYKKEDDKRKKVESEMYKKTSKATKKYNDMNRADRYRGYSKHTPDHQGCGGPGCK